VRIIVDIVHPANVLFFLRPIRKLLERGDQVLILSRHKDVAVSLLDSFGHSHTPISSAGNGLFGLAKELITRDVNLFRHVKRFRPDIMIGFGGVAISHVGRLTGVPAISFYDTELASLQTRITWPFISHLYVPSSYQGAVPARTTRVPGIKELSYLHPNSFRADEQRAAEAGFERGVDNFFLRVVSWRANHDFGKTGWTDAMLHEIVNYLKQRGRVHISSERPIPESLNEYRYRGRTSDLHHLLAHCKLYVGESATMACESAVLGTPSIYVSSDFRGYLEELSEAGLVHKAPPVTQHSVMEAIERTLAVPNDIHLAQHEKYIRGKPDWSEVVIEAIDRHAKTKT
jgi:predicted glycosyltransferase